MGLRSTTAVLTVTLAGLASARVGTQHSPASSIQFVFTSDVHYGLSRPTFRGRSNVEAHIVNAAMIRALNRLPDETFPKDGGLAAGTTVDTIDFVAVGGDIANRQEVTDSAAIQSAATSWAQFAEDYLGTLHLPGRSGGSATVYVVPGNHDISNAIGHFLPMTRSTDPTAMVEMFNLMMTPRAVQATTYRYPRDRVLVSHDIGGAHFMFVTMWPDSGVRAWMETDLAGISPSTPVVVFTHDQPEAEAKHFTNPNGRHDINATDKFENLLIDRLADGTTVAAPTDVEQRAFQGFLERHPNVTAYFHGHSNWNQFYDWTGPDNRVVLHTFRVDSPMKGAASSKDETKLSFQVVTIDAASRRMTVRECLWNVPSADQLTHLSWGGSTTVALWPRTPAPQSRAH